MRIWFIGSHGTGKTTQVEHFLNIHPEYHRIGSDRRQMVEDGIIKVNRDAAPWDEIVIGGDVMKHILSTPSPSISDRSWIDKCAYAQLLPVSDELLDAMHVYYSSAFPGVTEDDKYFLFPINVLPLVSDGIRDADKDYQEQVDSYVQYYLSHFGIHYHTVTSKTVQDRYLEIKEVLNIK